METRIRTMQSPKSFQTMTSEERSCALDEIVQEALHLGIDDIQIITPDKIVVDERVWYKCILACSGSNNGLHCPPNTLTPSQTKELLKHYSYAILLRKRGVPEDFSGIPELSESHDNRNKLGREFQLIIGKLEGLAFYKGFYLAIAFSGGRCKICSLSFECPGMKTGVCMHPFEARPPMEAVGIDVFSTMDKAGWKFSIIGRATDPCGVDVVGYTGVVLVY